MAKPAFTAAPRTDWKSVAQEVSKRLGKTYPGQYVYEVAKGWRSHKKIAPILVELGVKNQDPEEQKARSKRGSVLTVQAAAA